MNLTFSAYQARAHSTAVYPSRYWEYPFIGLAGEVGELCNQVKKIIRDDGGMDDPTQLTNSRRAKIQDEVGDVLWYVAEVCSSLGLSLEAVAAANLEKLAERARTNSIHGDNRR